MTNPTEPLPAAAVNAVSVSGFAQAFSVYEERMHGWGSSPPDIEHLA